MGLAGATTTSKVRGERRLLRRPPAKTSDPIANTVSMFTSTLSSCHLFSAVLVLGLTLTSGCGDPCDGSVVNLTAGTNVTGDDFCGLDLTGDGDPTEAAPTSDGSGSGDELGMSETSIGDPTETGEDWTPENPGPSDHCIRILYTDLQPDGLNLARGAAVTADGCTNAQDDIFLQIGTGFPFTVGDPNDVIVPISALPAGGCSSAHGPLALTFPAGFHLPMNLAPLVDGEWPQYHVLLLQRWNVVQGLIVGGEAPNGGPGPLMSDTIFNWHSVDSWDGSCTLLTP